LESPRRLLGFHTVWRGGFFIGRKFARLAPTGPRLFLQFDVIQRLVHRQFTEHDHLSDAQQGLAM
ncbi:hypothetical protein MMG91_27245, partial [Pseudomonas sp. JL3]